MITKLQINGYRLLNGFSADLRPLTVIIGTNASGKSTLLDCLQCISQCVDQPFGTVLSWHWGMVSLLNATDSDRKLRWEITFSRPDSPVWGQLPIDANLALVYEVVLQSGQQGQAVSQYETLRRTQPRPGFEEPFKYLEATPFRRSIYDWQSHQLKPFDEAIPQQRTARETGAENQSDGKTLPAQIQEPTLMLAQIRFFNEFPIPSAARVLLASMAFYPGFEVARYSALRTKAAEIRPVSILSPFGENLGTVLHETLTRYDFRDAASDLRLFLRTAYPSFEDINVETTFGTPPQVLVRIREKGMKRSMELWELSDGMLRFLCLATAFLSPTPPPFVAVDEPEAGLHPKLLPIIADLIKTASERTQVLVTTHSPDLLNCFDIEDVSVLARDETEPKAIWNRPADRQTLVKMLKEIGSETLGDLHRSGELETIK